MVQPVCEETQKSEMKLACLKDHLDLLMQKLMADERKWETIMMMQVKLVLLYHSWTKSNKNIHLKYIYY